MEKESGYYKIGHGLFWTVAIGLAGLIFYFGFYVGTAKFDNDKNKLYEENTQLRKDTASLSGKLNMNFDSVNTQLKKENGELKKEISEFKSNRESDSTQSGQSKNQNESLKAKVTDNSNKVQSKTVKPNLPSKFIAMPPPKDNKQRMKRDSI